jgi:hypothetical protein
MSAPSQEPHHGQPVAIVRHAGRVVKALKILVSAVQSRPCPPFLRPTTEENREVSHTPSQGSSGPIGPDPGSFGTRLVQETRLDPAIDESSATAARHRIETSIEATPETVSRAEAVPQQGFSRFRTPDKVRRLA